MTVAAAVGLLASAAYSSFPLQWVVGSRLSVIRSYVSELSVTGQPGALVFRVGDVIGGVGLVVLAAGLAASCVRGSRSAVAAVLALVVTGLGSAADGVWPMPCAPSADPVCRGLDRSSLTAQLAQTHTLTSLSEFTAAVIAAVLFGAVLLRSPGHHRLGLFTLAAGLAVGTLGLGEIVMVLTGSRVIGVPERVQVLLVSLFCAALSLHLLRRRRRAPASGGFSLRAG
ncbi:DUF998 domain-containing protein [Streptomyces sp. FH025]|uniref:DUF998 domain-containing protein n=1 Tax=Streptomyces sp. FH025 TaxID=2815937 RepID=UPI001A9F202C|nr:DUF998 domain-containing protein [Streptomyces sp. FH025]MBO1414559.1 DUF998 domain-containing protein [Streptomyces sp. FH025]